MTAPQRWGSAALRMPSEWRLSGRQEKTYLANNSVRAGTCESAEEFVWSSSGGRVELDEAPPGLNSPRENSVWHGTVPKGRLNLAQHESAGNIGKKAGSPGGTAEKPQDIVLRNLGRPFGTNRFWLRRPSTFVLGYVQPDLSKLRFCDRPDGVWCP